jgi:hypothetical protein
VRGYSYFHFDLDRIKVSQRSFDIYIMPQLKTIVSDFYLALKKVSYLGPQVITLSNLIQRFDRSYTSYLKSCEKKPCAGKRDRLRNLGLKINHFFLKLEDRQFTYFKKGHDVDSVVAFSRELARLSDLWHGLLNTIEGDLLDAHKQEVLSYLNLFHLKRGILLTGSLEKEYQHNFYAVWNQFILKLEEDIIKKRDRSFLLKRLERLNISWNSFYMKVSRWKDFLDAQTRYDFKRMHQRWNLVLKVILKR